MNVKKNYSKWSFLKRDEIDAFGMINKSFNELTVLVKDEIFFKNGKLNIPGDIKNMNLKFRSFDGKDSYKKSQEEKYEDCEAIVFVGDLFSSDEPVSEQEKPSGFGRVRNWLQNILEKRRKNLVSQVVRIDVL